MADDKSHIREIARLDVALAESREEVERLRAQLEQARNEITLPKRDISIEIQRVLVLSVNHLQKDTRAMCEAMVPTSWEPQIRHPFGWDWYVPSAGADVAEYPDEFTTIFEIARLHGCTWVRFDESGPELEQLPTWDGTPNHSTRGGR